MSNQLTYIYYIEKRRLSWVAHSFLLKLVIIMMSYFTSVTNCYLNRTYTSCFNLNCVTVKYSIICVLPFLTSLQERIRNKNFLTINIEAMKTSEELFCIKRCTSSIKMIWKVKKLNLLPVNGYPSSCEDILIHSLVASAVSEGGKEI